MDNGERPINIGVSNIVWLNEKGTTWLGIKTGAKISFLLENDEYKSLLIKLPKNFNGKLVTSGSVLHSVAIKGELLYTMHQHKEQRLLDVGSYFGSTDETTHEVSSNNKSDVIIYVRTNGFIKVEI